MARTGFWFQSARGRAMVRNRCMRRARFLKSSLGRPVSIYAADDRAASDERRRELIASEVRRAREANRDWRRYRKLAAQFD